MQILFACKFTATVNIKYQKTQSDETNEEKIMKIWQNDMEKQVCSSLMGDHRLIIN